MARIPTVMIKRGKQNVLINADEYDEKRDGKIIDNVEPEPAPTAAATVPAPSAPDPGNATAPATPSANQLLVEKKGKKFIVVDQDGKPVEQEGIDAKGYDDELGAWTAISNVSAAPQSPAA